MALKNYNKVEVKHFILSGNVMELNFYAQDILNSNPGFEVSRVVLLNSPKTEQYSLDSKLSLLYVLIKKNADRFVEPEAVEKAVKKDA